MIPTCDAIVVLGCAIRSSGVPSAALARRINLAFRAYEQGVAPRVIASGGRRWGDHVEAVLIARELVSRGVPEDAVFYELCSLSTRENCRFTAELLRKLGARRAMIATCAWHLPRAIGNFERLGVAAVSPPPSWLDTPPASMGVRVRERVCALADSVIMPRTSS
ncbi:MAG: YdcF family protein [Deltaproteobacteria bacterium]|nr:YdcF family protein [Deltaproteobacteria bacterium]